MFGYFNCFLRINLTDCTAKKESVDEKTLREYIGGSGLGAKFLYDEVDPKCDPLGKENKIYFFAGPLVGTSCPCSGRHAAVTKSPLTGIFAESDIGGEFGDMMRHAGYDGIILEGMSAKKVHILINEDDVKIEDASGIWGKDGHETYDLIKENFGADYESMYIGQGGENLVKYASIMTSGASARALGRCGIGAVMGSKGVKAISVKGKKPIPVFDANGLKESVKLIAGGLREAKAGMTSFGTAGALTAFESIGNLPLKNWSLAHWKDAGNISGQRMAETMLTKKYNCKSCFIGCGREVEITSGKYAGIKGGGPEYETIGLIGSCCMIDDLEAIAAANELCNRYGVDTITMGGAIAFVMELYEKKILSKEDLGGIEANFGSADALIALIHKIVARDGIGDALADGLREASKKIGKGSEKYAYHVKGLDFPAHDVRVYHGWALSAATGNRGCCHMTAFSVPFERAVFLEELGYDKAHSGHQKEGKAKLIMELQDIMGVFDSLKLCKFILPGSPIRLSIIAEWVSLVTGWDYTVDELMETGARIYNIKRKFNNHLGISKKDDVLPEFFTDKSRTDGGFVEVLPDMEYMLNEYYALRGWDENGIVK